MIQDTWDGSTATVTGMQSVRSKLCMGLQYLVLASLEAKGKQTHFGECKPIFETEIDDTSSLAADLSSFWLYPELPKG